jgi:transcriptional regulator with XRE-family HTH domain
LPRNTSINADIRDARNELGARLRELRRAAGLNGQQLAEVLSWQGSKVSKIENGRQTPTDDDVRAWCRAVGAEGEIERLLADLHTLETRHAEWQQQVRGGLARVQESVAKREAATRTMRSFQLTFVPGLLQTPGYARARLEQSGRRWGRSADVDEAVAARMARQAVLYEPGRGFHFVIAESVLLFALCPPEAMLAQIDRLVSLSMLENVRLGIVPFDRPYVVAPKHGFSLLDDRLVTVETFTAELNLAQPQEIKMYRKVFDSMALAADYDRKARTHMHRAAEQIEQRIERSEQT